MLHSIEQISYHILMMLLPLIVYHLFIKEEKQRRHKMFSNLMFISLIMLFLTMSNPVEFSAGFLYDFRVIPIILAFLYGGVRPGILVIVIMLVYRYSFGGSGFYVTLINYSIAACILVYAKRKFDSCNLQNRLLLISSFYWVIAFTRAVTLIQIGQAEQLMFMLIFSILTWVTLIILVCFIENLDIQIANYKHIQSAERLSVVSQLAAAVAHEVRNPMTSIKGFLQLIKNDENLNKSQNKYIAISLDELDRTEAVINDYLSLAKPSSVKSDSKLNVTSELQAMVGIMTSYTNSHNIRILPCIQDELFSKGKQNEFKQAILNIMKNSVEAINENGTLAVNAYRKNDHVHIEIKDDGIGMTKKQAEQLGTPYYSTKDKGTGVGLTITYKIIKDMNGKIAVKSEKGVGTIFTIVIPAEMWD